MTTEQITALLPSAALFIAAIAALITALSYVRRKNADTLDGLVSNLIAQLNNATQQMNLSNATIETLRKELREAIEKLDVALSRIDTLNLELGNGVTGFKNLQATVEDFILNDGGTGRMKKALEETKIDEPNKDEPT